MFREPWEAHAFALAWRCTSTACSAGRNGPPRWPRRSRARRPHGDADLGDTYYRHWLAALESLVAAKGASSAQRAGRYRDAWDRAADRTPHGQPIELQARDFDPA